MGKKSKKAIAKPLKTQKEIQSLDNMVNFITGLGTERSKRESAMWRFEGINNFVEYEACYQSNWIARRICDVIPSDMTREWRAIKCEKADDIRALEDKLQIREKICRGESLARLYGGAIGILITDQPLDKPLDVNKIGKDSFKNLIVLDRWFVSPVGDVVMDVFSDNFMLPSGYIVSNTQSTEANANGPIIHHSHTIRFEGEPLPPRLKYREFGWGDSALRQSMEAVKDFTASVGGVAEAMQEFNVDVIRRAGLFREILSRQGDAIIRRFRAAMMGKSIFKALLLDEDENFERKNLNFSGISDIIEIQMKIIAGASHTPVTKLFGDSAKGLNATGEGDDVNYNTYIRTQQASKLDPMLRKLDEVLVRSALGYFPEDFNYEWKPLDVPSPLEQAQAKLTMAQAHNIYLENGVICVSQVQRELQSNEEYQFDEERIQELREIENEEDLARRYSESNNTTLTNGEGGGEATQEANSDGLSAGDKEQDVQNAKQDEKDNDKEV